MDVVVYTTPTCPYCNMVKEYLTRRGVLFREYNVTTDPAAAMEMVRRSGQRGVPVTIIGDEVIVGYDPQRLEMALARHASGPRAGGAKPRLGVRIADAASIARQRGSGPTVGAYVGAVYPASPAEKAGLRPGDVITAFNDHIIHRADDVYSFLDTAYPGQRVRIFFLRDGHPMQAEVVL